MNFAKELKELREQLAALKKRDAYYIVLRKDDTEEAAREWHISQGMLDPDRMEVVWVHSKIPGASRPTKVKSFEEYPVTPVKQEEEPPSHIPAYLRAQQQEIEASPPLEVKAQKRTKLWYPENVY